MRHYYATAAGHLITEDFFDGGYLRYTANSEPYLDLFRFNSRKERDEFVNDSNDHASITLQEINANSHLKQQL